MRRLLFLPVLLSAFCIAQSQPDKRMSRFSVYSTAGPNYFLNNFHQFRKKVNTVDYNISFRIVWEPSYRLSLGLKTGYYKIYTVSLTGGKANAHFDLSAIPIQLWVKTKVSKHLYAFFGMGPSLCLNTMKANNGESIHASFLSYADVSTGFGYQRSINRKLSLGGEFEFFHSSKSAENLITMALVAGWKL
jgi:hypothetical protein